MNVIDSSIVDRLLGAPQYSLDWHDKSSLLLEELGSLTTWHREHCEAYGRILDGFGRRLAPDVSSLVDVPFLPVRLFKSLKLQSVSDSDVLKVLTSSGTTSQQKSKIAIDRDTSMLQTKALAAIATSFIGTKRLPMIIIDSMAVLGDRQSMSARGAGLVGLSNFGRDHLYALNEDMRLNLPALKSFIEKHGEGPILIFGFTFMVWQYLYQELERLGETFSLAQAILIHSGGWKKLQDQQVSNDTFKSALRRRCGIERIHNFYGMVEQVGGIYMECESGFFHAPNTSDILVRDYHDWSIVPSGRSGLLQTLSVLPRSYPGHSLLTEDLGTVHGVDDCPCGRKGVRFLVQGRMPQAELRGCSDTHALGTPPLGAAQPVRQFLPVPLPSTTIESLCPDELLLRHPLAAFDPLVVDFLDATSREILKLPTVKSYPELVTLAFWLRRTNLQGIVDAFQKSVGTYELAIPWGVAFHVAPANVDTIFLYSWALAMLAGNINLVRVSQNNTVQLGSLLSVLQRMMSDPRWQQIAERNVVLTYPRDERLNRFLSERADVRIVWGGDDTVQDLRRLPAKPQTKEISFADKISSTVVHAERYLKCSEEAAAGVTKSFFNDAYQFDQLACSSPHFVFFVGAATDCSSASELFWSRLTRHLHEIKRDEHISSASGKLTAASELLGRVEGSRWVWGRHSPSPLVVRVPLNSISICRHRVGGGFFVECCIGELADLAAFVQRGDQTLSYVEFTRDEMRTAAGDLCVRGFDRIVPVGQALAFGPVWDGYVLLGELTRRVSVS